MKIAQKFMDWYQGNNKAAGEPPKGGIKRVGYVLWNYTGNIIVVNFLFILCCIPIVTIPAALTALNRYLVKIFRDGYGFALSDYFQEFKESIGKRLPLGILVGFIDFYAYYLLSLANNFTQSGQRDIVTGIGFGVAIVGSLIGSYVFMLAAMLDLKNTHLLKNACILMLLEWKTSLLVILTAGIFVFIVFGLMPYSVVLLVFGGFAILHLFLCAWLNPVVQRRIIEPFEKGKN